MRIITSIILLGLVTIITLSITGSSNLNLDFKHNQLNVLSKFESKNVTNTDNPMYNFLLASLASYRNYPQVAKTKFKELLELNKEPKIAEILTELAIGTEDLELLKFSTKIWAALEPKNYNVQLMAAVAWLDDEQPLIIEKYLQQAINLNPTKIDSYLAGLLPTLTEQEIMKLQNILENLTIKEPNNPINQVCLAQIAAQLNNIDLAIIANNNALELKPDLTNAISLKAKLIRVNSISDDKALSYLKKQVYKFPKDEELSLFYAKALADNEKHFESLTILKKLFNSINQEIKMEATLLAAEIKLQEQNVNLKEVKKQLYNLIKDSLISDKLYFILAQIHEKEGDITAAIKLYTYISEEPYLIISCFRAALLLANNGNFEQAIAILNQIDPSNLLEKKQLLLFKIELALELQDLIIAMNSANEGLELLPNDIDFLYAHSIIASLDNQTITAEQDLKRIIQLDPENHNALNALGFILIADHARLEESLGYLQAALKLSPNNPVYMDSMGLLLFNMGKIPESIEILTRAYNLNNNLSIAIHLGEALWINGQTKQATFFWKKAWQIDENNLELIKLLTKYNINFLKAGN